MKYLKVDRMLPNDPELEGRLNAFLSCLDEKDLKEMLLMHGEGISPYVHLKKAISEAKWVYLMSTKGNPEKPLLIFGLTEVDKERACPWCIHTTHVDTEPLAKREIVRVAPGYLAQMDYPLLYNAIHKDNKKALRWVSSLGFTLQDGPEWTLAIKYNPKT